MTGPISKILEKIGKKFYQSTFVRQKVESVDTCKLLTYDDLKELGIVTIGDRAAFRDAVNRFSEEEKSPATKDSQEETPISPSQSQDLFADGGNGSEMSQAVGLQILKYLKELDCKITKLQDDVKKIRKSNQLHVLTFNMASCSFKKKLNIYLKNKFSRCPWMDMRTDEEFKMEIKRCLQREGYGSDPAAFKAVSAWSAEKFTSFRNQLRRKIITEIKENRRDLKQLPIEEFASILLDSYCDATEDVRHPQRIQFALVLRSFLHHKKFMVEGSDEMEFYSDFWVTFKEFYSEVTVNEDSEKWAKLRSIDERRVKKYQAAAATGAVQTD